MTMAHTEFQNRLARIRGTQPTVELPPDFHVTPEPAGGAAVAQYGAMGLLDLKTELVLAPFAFLIGLTLPVLADLIFFHYVMAPGLMFDSLQTDLVLFMVDAGIDAVLCGSVVLFLTLRGWWFATFANVVGGYVGLWHMEALVRLVPEVFATLFSPAYVQDMLMPVAQAPFIF